MYKIVENKLSLGGRESDIKIHFPSWDKGVSFSAGYRIIILHTYIVHTFEIHSIRSGYTKMLVQNVQKSSYNHCFQKTKQESAIYKRIHDREIKVI